MSLNMTFSYAFSALVFLIKDGFFLSKISPYVFTYNVNKFCKQFCFYILAVNLFTIYILI